MPFTPSMVHDIGSFLDHETALIPAVITAGAGNDGVVVSGPAFDRVQTGRETAMSCKLMLFGTVTLAVNETLTIAANLQDDTVAAFNGTPAALTPALVTTVVAGPGVVTAGKWRIALDVDLAGAREFIRAQVTANLSAVGTDTVQISGAFALGGQQQLPPTAF